MSTQCQWSFHSPLGLATNEPHDLFPRKGDQGHNYQLPRGVLGCLGTNRAQLHGDFGRVVPKSGQIASCPHRTLTTEEKRKSAERIALQP